MMVEVEVVFDMLRVMEEINHWLMMMMVVKEVWYLK
jgi:hypothetical protein